MPTSPRQSPVTPKRRPAGAAFMPIIAAPVVKVAVRTFLPSVTRTKCGTPRSSPLRKILPGSSALSTTIDCCEMMLVNAASRATSISTVPVPAAGRTRTAAFPPMTSPTATRGSASDGKPAWADAVSTSEAKTVEVRKRIRSPSVGLDRSSGREERNETWRVRLLRRHSVAKPLVFDRIRVKSGGFLQARAKSGRAVKAPKSATPSSKLGVAKR